MLVDVSLIFKIAGVGILIVILEQIFKGFGKNEQATLITLAGLVVVLMMVLTLISRLFDSVRTMFQL
jgi:stage III sporulation protein AC